MHIAITHQGHTVRVDIQGELTIYSVGEVKQSLTQAMQQGEDIVVDLANVIEADTAGLQLLLLAKRRPGWHISYVQHSPAILRLLAISDMGRLLGDPLVIASSDPVH